MNSVVGCDVCLFVSKYPHCGSSRHEGVPESLSGTFVFMFWGAASVRDAVRDLLCRMSTVVGCDVCLFVWIVAVVIATLDKNSIAPKLRA